MKCACAEIDLATACSMYELTKGQLSFLRAREGRACHTEDHAA
jgi:hypothetical protein